MCTGCSLGLYENTVGRHIDCKAGVSCLQVRKLSHLHFLFLRIFSISATTTTTKMHSVNTEMSSQDSLELSMSLLNPVAELVPPLRCSCYCSGHTVLSLLQSLWHASPLCSTGPSDWNLENAPGPGQQRLGMSVHFLPHLDPNPPGPTTITTLHLLNIIHFETGSHCAALAGL